MLPANDDNPKGFFENASIVEFNDRLLKHLGLCWDYLGPAPTIALDDDAVCQWMYEAEELLQREFQRSHLIAIKDPRLCLLSSFWSAVLAQRTYAVDHVLVLRHPYECAQSQAARFARDPGFHFVGGDPVEGMLLWARYLHDALLFLMDKSFVVASHARFLKEPGPAADQLCKALNLTLRASEASAFAQEFVEPPLHRNRAPENVDGQVLDRWSQQFAAVFQALMAREGMEMQPGGTCRAAAEMLAALLKSELWSDSVLRLHVRARHAAVETRLELAEAKRILAFQEAALEADAKRIQRLEEQIARTKEQFVAERRANETLRLALAAAMDTRHNGARESR